MFFTGDESAVCRTEIRRDREIEFPEIFIFIVYPEIQNLIDAF